MKKHLEFLLKSEVLGKLSHAYIFSGNDKEKKKDTVQKFLQFLFCADKKRPCKKCNACQAVEYGRHPDITVITPGQEGKSKEITVSQIRGLNAKLSLGAWQGPYKVAILEDAHSMNLEAQSALLKLLEEPKGNTVFILLCDHVSLLLHTIQSRAQELSFYVFSPVVLSEIILRENVKDFVKMQRMSLYERFAFAKELADSPERIPEVLSDWISFMRARILEELAKKEFSREKILRMKHFIVLTQEIATVLNQTNAQPRLALEQILISF